MKKSFLILCMLCVSFAVGMDFEEKISKKITRRKQSLDDVFLNGFDPPLHRLQKRWENAIEPVGSRLRDEKTASEILRTNREALEPDDQERGWENSIESTGPYQIRSFQLAELFLRRRLIDDQGILAMWDNPTTNVRLRDLIAYEISWNRPRLLFHILPQGDIFQEILNLQKAKTAFQEFKEKRPDLMTYFPVSGEQEKKSFDQSTATAMEWINNVDFRSMSGSEKKGDFYKEQVTLGIELLMGRKISKVYLHKPIPTFARSLHESYSTYSLDGMTTRQLFVLFMEILKKSIQTREDLIMVWLQEALRNERNFYAFKVAWDLERCGLKGVDIGDVLSHAQTSTRNRLVSLILEAWDQADNTNAHQMKYLISIQKKWNNIEYENQKYRYILFEYLLMIMRGHNKIADDYNELISKPRCALGVIVDLLRGIGLLSGVETLKAIVPTPCGIP